MITTLEHDLGRVAETLLIPLYNRAMESQRPDALLRDEKAVELVTRMRLDFSRVRQLPMPELLRVMRIIFAREMDRLTRDFLARHLQAAAVHIGCGLDTRAARVDNGRRLWFGLDLPEVIGLRRSLLPAGPREFLVERSVLDPAWMERIAAERRPVFFAAEGVSPYLSERDLRTMIALLAERFPGGELAFDALTKFSIWLHNMHPLLRKAGARLHWGIDRGRDMERWSPHPHWLETSKYLDHREPRLGSHNLMRFLPVLSDVNDIVRYGLTV
jgi:O-methyltransferase involved in polyketide biosynthesis